MSLGLRPGPIVPLVASQPQYSMLWRVIESQVVPACEREGLGQAVWSPLAQGILSGKYLPGTAAPSDSRAARRPARASSTCWSATG